MWSMERTALWTEIWTEPWILLIPLGMCVHAQLPAHKKQHNGRLASAKLMDVILLVYIYCCKITYKDNNAQLRIMRCMHLSI